MRGIERFRDSTPTPKHKLIIINEKIVIIVDFLPNIFTIVVMDVVFVAGPTIRKTSAAPNVTPFDIIASAMGIDAVAHTYKGKPIIIMMIMDRNPCPIKLSMMVTGKYKLIIAAIIIPIMSGFIISFGNVINE